jgi:hypothetical protein
MGIIGYFEGTDPLVLANLSIAGHQTLPLGNGFDNYGKFVAQITESDKIDVVVGYFHKVIPTADMTITSKDILAPVIKLNIPILLICGRENYGMAKELLGDMADRIRLTAPERMEEAIISMIK